MLQRPLVAISPVLANFLQHLDRLVDKFLFLAFGGLLLARIESLQHRSTAILKELILFWVETSESEMETLMQSSQWKAKPPFNYPCVTAL